MVKKQSYVISIQTVSLYTRKQMVFLKILQKMLKLDLIFQVMNQIDHCRKRKIKKVIRLMKNELDGNIMIKLVGLTAKTHSYFIDDGREDKKAKGTRVCHKWKT